MAVIGICQTGIEAGDIKGFGRLAREVRIHEHSIVDGIISRALARVDLKHQEAATNDRGPEIERAGIRIDGVARQVRDSLNRHLISLPQSHGGIQGERHALVVRVQARIVNVESRDIVIEMIDGCDGVNELRKANHDVRHVRQRSRAKTCGRIGVVRDP